MEQQQRNLGHRLCHGQSSISFFYMMTYLIQLKEEWMHNVLVITTEGREDPD